MVKVLCLLALTLTVAAAWPAGKDVSKEDIFKGLIKLKMAKKAVDKVREKVKSEIEPEELMRVKKEFLGNVKLRLLAKKLKAMMAEMGPMEAQHQMERMMAEMGSQEDESDSGSEESAEMPAEMESMDMEAMMREIAEMESGEEPESAQEEPDMESAAEKSAEMDMEAMMQQIAKMMRQQMESEEEPEPAGEESEMESAGESEEEMEGASVEEIAKKCFAEFKRKMAEASGNNPEDMGGDEPGPMNAEPDLVAKFAEMARLKVKAVALFKTFIEFEIGFMTQGKILEKSKGKLDEKAIRGLFFEVFARFVESSMKIKEGAEKRFKFIDFVEAKLQKVQEKKRELEKKKRKFMEFAKAMLAKKD